MRVVLYAEGHGDLGGELDYQLAPGDQLVEESLGAAHVLVRRLLAETRGLPEPAILFEEPLRTRARRAKGSDLHHLPTLRQLLTWPRAEQRPDLVVVLVDSDGDAERKRSMQAALPNPHHAFVAMAVKDLESWLIADREALRKVLSAPGVDEPIEALPSGRAKELLSGWCSKQDGRGARRSLAQVARLDAICKACPAFDDLFRELRAAAP